jgi:hypothetical protein
LFSNGTFAEGHTYKVKLLTAATYDAIDVTLAETGGTEVSNANGYTTGGATLTGVAVTTVNTDDSKFDANDATWSATGSGITASFAILYNDTVTNDPPVAFINFDGSESAGAGTDFLVQWDANGIVTWTKS